MMDIDKPVDRNQFDFDVPRYWSSPRMIPGRMIIAHVLFNPSDHDIRLILDHFGRDIIIERFNLLLSDPDFRLSARRICIRNLFDVAATFSTKDVIGEIEKHCCDLTEELRKKHSVLYGAAPQHPGKIVAFFKDGTQKIGEWRDGKFVPDPAGKNDR